MTAMVSLRRVDDALRLYTISQDGQHVGEIRPRKFGSAELHLPEGGLLLRRDDTADLYARGGTTAALLRESIGFKARWSLRDGETVLARAHARFALSPTRCGADLEFTGPPARALQVRASSTFGPPAVSENGQRLTLIDARRGRWEFAMPDLLGDRARSLFLLYIAHQQLGAHPSSADGTSD